ncbi:hypothetical protein RRG08_046937 [Elysia crispata]|uniref:Uncharacterized protein n=1 Tax=Elysia crispata TaxID=231223 RepID=A0AAE1A897_9GAST|nr:hypothetical protein RRG08_046937 [Elysia crispata]
MEADKRPEQFDKKCLNSWTGFNIFSNGWGPEWPTFTIRTALDLTYPRDYSATCLTGPAECRPTVTWDPPTPFFPPDDQSCVGGTPSTCLLSYSDDENH